MQLEVQSPAELVDEADRAIGAGNLRHGHHLLVQAVRQQPDNVLVLLKLAGIQRALGEPQQALETVNRTLAVNPRDFLALVMRASLLEQIDPPSSGEAWAVALVQRPTGKLPERLMTAIEHGAQLRDRWIAEREQRTKFAMESAEEHASEEELQRIQRFRSNALRLTRPFHSEPTEYHFPGLAEFEFHPRSSFPWLCEVEAATAEITAELDRLLSSDRRDVEPYIQYEEYLPLDQWRPLNRNLDWTAVHLLKSGERVAANAELCPFTMNLLERLPQPNIAGVGPNAMFSLLAPKTSIPPHVGVSNTRLVCHLPLIVPERCWFRVGAETRSWHPGKAFVFDDTVEHEARNDSDQLRVVFIFDVWNPQLSVLEREAVTALMTSIS